jgi:hypothetical protein
VTGSLAYRNNEREILRGRIPKKYTRILPHIPGERILEIGSAEGVLALCLARADMGAKKEVIALERRQDRHESALALHSNWARVFKFQCHPAFVCGDIGDHLDLLDGIDTLVAVRMIYYLRERLDEVFAEVARKVPNIVLCGNRNRADRHALGFPDKPDGPLNLYAGSKGMRELLMRHGYRIASEVTEGDEIVVGRKDG